MVRVHLAVEVHLGWAINLSRYLCRKGFSMPTQGDCFFKLGLNCASDCFGNYCPTIRAPIFTTQCNNNRNGKDQSFGLQKLELRPSGESLEVCWILLV